jgi:hypothetical protein
MFEELAATKDRVAECKKYGVCPSQFNKAAKALQEPQGASSKPADRAWTEIARSWLARSSQHY